MNKQEQIEEMAVLGCVRNPQAHTAEECSKCDFKQGMCNAYRHAEALYNAGYRKEQKTAKEILLLLGKGYDETEKTEFNNLQWYKEFCRELKHRYGVEVEE